MLLLNTTQMSSKNIVAIDLAHLGPHFGAILDGGAITTFERKNFNIDLPTLQSLSERYKTTHFILTGPNTNFLPNKHGDLILEKKPRLDMLRQGIHFLVEGGPTLVVLFELGCHLFYRAERETLYLGTLPYTFASFGLTENVPITTEMGHQLKSALEICQTHKLPQTRVLDRYETLIAYTLALGIKEFQARYKIKNLTINGTITPEQKELLTSFLLPSSSIANYELKIANCPVLPYPEHIAIFGMLSPYLEKNAGEN